MSKNKKYMILVKKNIFEFEGIVRMRTVWKTLRYDKERLISKIVYYRSYLKIDLLKQCVNNLGGLEIEDGEEDRYLYQGITSKEEIYICKETKNGIKPVDLVQLETEVNKRLKEKEVRKEHRNKEIEYNKKSEYRKFRVEPVPFTGKLSHRGYYRSVCLKPQQLQNIIYKEFEKPKYRGCNLDYYKLRYYDNNWKSSYKVDKQWKKHVRKHCDTTYMDRHQYDIDETLDIDALLEEEFESKQEVA